MPSFHSYQPSQRWSPEDFDTGAGKVHASLANIPRQIFEGVQVGKENALKEREMANRETQTKQAEQKNIADQEYQNKHLALLERKEENDLEREAIRDEQFNRQMKLQEKVAEERMKVMRMQINQAAKDGKSKELAASFQFQKTLHENNAARYLMTKDIFADPARQQEFRANLKTAGSTTDVIHLFQQELMLNGHKPGYFKKDALSILQPMIRERNFANEGYWRTGNGTPAPDKFDELDEVIYRESDYSKRTGKLNATDPAIQRTLEVLGATDDDKERLLAALGSVINKLDSNSINFTKHEFNRAKTAYSVIMKELEKERKAKSLTMEDALELTKKRRGFQIKESFEDIF